MRSWGSRLTRVVHLRRWKDQRKIDGFEQSMHHNQWLHRTTNTATSQQWEEDGNTAEHIGPPMPNLLQPGRICGLFWWWAGLYGAISPQIPCTAINPTYTSEPNAIGKREWLCSVYRPEIFMHHSQTILVWVAILFMANTRVGWKNKTLYAAAACSWVLNL